MTGSEMGQKRHAKTIRKRWIALAALAVVLTSLLVLAVFWRRSASLEGRLAAVGLSRLPDSAVNVQFETPRGRNGLRLTFIKFDAEREDIKQFIETSRASAGLHGSHAEQVILTVPSLSGEGNYPSWWPREQRHYWVEAWTISSSPGSITGGIVVDNYEKSAYMMFWRPPPFPWLRRYVPFL